MHEQIPTVFHRDIDPDLDIDQDEALAIGNKSEVSRAKQRGDLS